MPEVRIRMTDYQDKLVRSFMIDKRFKSKEEAILDLIKSLIPLFPHIKDEMRSEEK